MISDTRELETFCETCAQFDYVTVDTEFLRERTYYSQLCLVQLAHPGDGPHSAKLIDPLSENLDLAPLYKLFANPDVVKVFHAARQDLEIFFVEGDMIPAPFFDTQVAAMVCGFGDQVGYETLVRAIAKEKLDKSSRFTDWSKRPLSDRQQSYALADVTHLRDIYRFLDSKLDETGRRGWVEEELAILTDPATYTVVPEEAWRRIKTRNTSPRNLAIVRELAQYREETARNRNVPRNRIMKDDVIIELAGTKPTSPQELGKSRLLQREMRRDPHARDLIDAIKRGLNCPQDQLPEIQKNDSRRKVGTQGLVELFRVLLKARSEDAGVAPKLIASASDLEILAADDKPDMPCMKGWRYELFGQYVEQLKQGKVALSAGPKGVQMVELGG